MSRLLNVLIQENEPIEELDFSLFNMSQKEEHIRKAFYSWWKEFYGNEYDVYCNGVYMDHPALGNSVIVSHRGVTEAAEYTLAENGEVTFADKSAWRAVMNTWIFVDEMPIIEPEAKVEETLAESSMGVEIVEAGKPNDGPVKLRIIPIQAGPGNKRDGHYYPLDVIKRDIGVFEGAKMYATDHKQDEKSTLTEVATVLKVPDGFAESGEPYALIGVHDPNFAKSIQNRATLGTLDKLSVSILGKGNARAGKVGEASYKIVESISEGKAIDFVTNAGAGGHAVALAESEVDDMPKKDKKDVLEEVEISEQDEEQNEESLEEVEETPVPMSPEEVKSILGKSGLQETSQAHLAEAVYTDEATLRQAIYVEKQYISSILGAGKPVDMGETASKPIEPVNRKEILEAAKAAANAAVFGGVPR